MANDTCTICGRRLNIEGDELSGDCGGDCWGCIGQIEADMGYEPSIKMLMDEWRRGLRPNWTPPKAITELSETVTLMSPDEIEAHLKRIHNEAERLAALIDVPEALRLKPSAPAGDGCWLTLYWREANDGDDQDGYYVALMSREHGQEWELSEVSLEYTDNLLFKFYEGVTHQMVMREQEKTSGVDQRRSMFAAQEALMARLNPEWSNRTSQRHEQILRNFPYSDKTQ